MKCELAPLLHQALCPYEEECRRRGIEVVRRLQPTDAWVDARQMLACFENLIDNAARSMPHGGRLDLIMRRRAELDLCEIEIADTGEGMAQEDAQCLLRGEPPRDVPVRNGMGLFLSRLYCESQGGRLEVQTSAGAGTRIRISIPLRPEEMEIAEGASLKPLSAAHPHDGGFAGTTRVRG